MPSEPSPRILVTTSTSSSNSHHRNIGKAIASGNLDAVTEAGGNVRSEGVHAVEQLREHGLLEIRKYPLLELVSQLLDDPVDAEKRLDAWIRRRFSDHASP
jgi:glycerol-3-phosphate dehydrogenase